MSEHAAITRGASIFPRRVAAYLLDITLLFALLAPAGWAIQQFTGAVPDTGPEIWRTLLLNFSLPVWLYFIAFESSARGATPGKRIFGIRVSSTRSSGPLLWRILVRTAIKLAPWELVHIASFAIAPAGGHFTIAQAVGLGLAWLLMIVYLIVVWRSDGHVGPHDRLAGTYVTAVDRQSAA